MEQRLAGTAGACLAMMAAMWPLGVFMYIPGLNMHATTLLAIFAFVLVLLDALRRRVLRVPFELIVPWLAIAAICLYLAATTTSEMPRTILPGLMIFVVPIHFRPSPAQVRRWLELTAVGGIAAAVMTAGGWLAGWMPTAYSLATGAGLHFASDVAGGIATLFVFLVLASALALVPRTRWPLRILWVLGAVSIAAVVATTIAAHAPAIFAPGPPVVHSRNSALVVLTVLLIYGIARTTAKVKENSEERPTDLHVVLLLVLTIMAAGAIIVGDVPMVGYGFIAGLAAGYALRSREPQPGRAFHSLAIVVAATLLVLNTIVVFPSHREDGRNYHIAAATDFAAGNYDRLHRRLDYVEHHAPNESRTHWWRARVLLAQDRPMRAVTEFQASLQDSSHSLLPVPQKDEQDVFLLQLRDVESASRAPQAAYGYARALVAIGNTDEALAFVRLQAKSALQDMPPLNTQPLADAISFLLGDKELAAPLRNWESDELLAVLQNWRAAVVAAPAWFDVASLPIVLVGAVDLDTTKTLVTMPGDRDVQEKPFSVEPQASPNVESSWAPLFGDARKWVVEWTAPTRGRGPARITGREETWDLLTYAATFTAIPEQAAVTVWVPDNVAPAIVNDAASTE